jgi:hypothetical protein
MENTVLINGTTFEVKNENGIRSIQASFDGKNYTIKLNKSEINKKSNGYVKYREAVFSKIRECDFRKYITPDNYVTRLYEKDLHGLPTLNIDADLPKIIYGKENPKLEYGIELDETGFPSVTTNPDAKKNIKSPSIETKIGSIKIENFVYCTFYVHLKFLLCVNADKIEKIQLNLDGSFIPENSIPEGDFKEIAFNTLKEDFCLFVENQHNVTKKFKFASIKTVEINQKKYNVAEFEYDNLIVPFGDETLQILLNSDMGTVDKTFSSFKDFEDKVKNEYKFIRNGYSSKLDYRKIPLSKDGYFLKDTKEYIDYFIAGGQLHMPVPNWLFPPLDCLLESGLVNFLSAPFLF